MSIPPPGPLAYEGQIVVPYIIRNFPPTSSFNTFLVPTIWIDPLHKNAYILGSKPLGVADWILMGSVSGGIFTITTPDSNVVSPIAGNIDFLNGMGVTITSSGNQITFNSVGGGFTWNEVTALDTTIEAGNGYVANNGAQIAFSLPLTANFGDYSIISGLGAGGWMLNQNAGQSVIIGDFTSTIGVGGSIASTKPHDSIEILCVVADTTFKIQNWSGNPEVT